MKVAVGMLRNELHLGTGKEQAHMYHWCRSSGLRLFDWHVATGQTCRTET